MKLLFAVAALTILHASLFGVKIPAIFFEAVTTQNSTDRVQIGIVRDFNPGNTAILHHIGGNIFPKILTAVHPESGKYALFVSSSNFEDFDFGNDGRHVVFGRTDRGPTGWTVADSIYDGKNNVELPPEFSLDGNKIFSAVLSRSGSILNGFDLQTGSVEKIFYSRWPGWNRFLITDIAISSDDRRVAFVCLRSRGSEIYSWNFNTNELPSLLAKSRFLLNPGKNSCLFLGKDFLLYKTTFERRYHVNETVLHLLDLRINENYELFQYAEVRGKNDPYADTHYVINEKEKILYLADSKSDPQERSGSIYRVNLRTLKVDLFIPNAIRVFDISKDGRFLLYSKYREETDLADPIHYPGKDTPQVIAVYDLQTGKSDEMELPDIIGYNQLGFVYSN